MIKDEFILDSFYITLGNENINAMMFISDIIVV